jgi:uncharacterized protein YukE
MFERQNDDKALSYLKAYAYCEKKDRAISMWTLFASLGFFVAAVVTRFLNAPPGVTIVINISTILFLIALIPVGMVARHANRDSARFLSLYECYVYDIPVNRAIVASFTQNETEAYARKMNKRPERYINFLFKAPEETKGKYSVYDRQYRIVKDQDLLMKYSKPFWFTIWIGFMLAVLIIALTDESSFLDAFINMMLPSLPVITLILRNWQIFNESSNRLKNTLADMDRKRESCKKSWTNAELQEYLLQAQMFNQEAIFLLRLLEFTIPAIMEKRSKKYYSAPLHAIIEEEEEDAPKQSFLAKLKPQKDDPAPTVYDEPAPKPRVAPTAPKATAAPVKKPTTTAKPSGVGDIVRKETKPKPTPKK